MKTQMYAYIALAFLLSAGASYGIGKFTGYNNGIAKQKARQEEDRQKTQQSLFKLGETISVQAAELETLKRERVQLVHEIEQQAISAEGASNPGISSTGGLQRLEHRWRKAGSTTK